MLPFDQALGQPLVQEIAIEEEGDDPLAEAGAHCGQVDLWDVDEPAVPVEATLEHEAVPVRIPSAGLATAPPRRLSGTLKHEDHSGAEKRAGGRGAEVPYQPVDEAKVFRFRDPRTVMVG